MQAINMERVMAKKPKQPKKKVEYPAVMMTPKFQYHCRCYSLGNGVYEMWILDPKSGTYNGPTPCTKEQCIACNMSKAVLIGK
jgi:hypothetical protein